MAALDYWLVQYRRTWRGTVVSGVLSPVLFLTAMGVGLGALVDDGGRLGQEYLLFLAPGLLAATAMQTAVGESTYPVMGAIKWIRTYHGMLATPLDSSDILHGHLVYVALRTFTTSVVFAVIMALFGAAPSFTGAGLAVLAATLCGMAFATPVFAFSAAHEADAGFAALERFGIVPMFLFSGTFFPISQLPTALEWVARVTPIWHGVELCRGLVTGTLGAAAGWGHVGYLVGWVVLGALVARIVFRRRLEATG
ncbi:MAG: ABC transporter permease [Geodermatophilaceae bacterium]|nr:ABC transporter permease [Geodermatophilaceae bacterium]